MSGDLLKRAVIDALKLPLFGEVPDYRILRPVTNRLYPKKYAVTYMVQSRY